MHLSWSNPIGFRSFIPGSLSITLALLFIYAPAAGQSRSGLDPSPPQPGRSGRHIIEGQLRYPDGRSLDKPIGVKLSSAAGGDQFAMSDERGSFVFRGLRGGVYYLSADVGQVYETINEKVDVIELGSQQVVSLQISLRPKTRPVEMIGTVDAALAGVPESALKLYRKAIETAQSGNREKAIEELKKALSIHPGFLMALNELGVQHLRLKQSREAIDALRSALKISPGAFAPRLNYGIALLQLKDYRGAVSELQRACEKEGTSAAAHLHLGRAFIGLNRYDGAEKALVRAIEIGGAEVIEAHRYLAAVCIEKGQNSRAADELEKYLLLAPKVKDADRIRKVISQLRSQTPVQK
jgi:tetratricopeptide (TPR) repeat protein